MGVRTGTIMQSTTTATSISTGASLNQRYQRWLRWLASRSNWRNSTAQ